MRSGGGLRGCTGWCAQGAPETIEERLAVVPEGYSDAYKRHTRQGSRVLALAYKNLPEMTVRSRSSSIEYPPCAHPHSLPPLSLPLRMCV